MGEVEEEVVYYYKMEMQKKQNEFCRGEYFMASTSSKQIKASEFGRNFFFVLFCVCELLSIISR
jgi:hypothetical protein